MDAAPQRTPDTGISTARKMRLGLMVGALVLCVVLAVSAAYRQRQGRTKVMDAARQALRELKLEEAANLLANARLTTRGQAEAARLAVPLYYAGGARPLAVATFNDLDSQALLASVDPEALTHARAIASGLGIPADEISRLQIGDQGAEYVRRCGALWNLARSIMAPAQGDRQRALLLCRWFALHTAAEPLGQADLREPYAVVLSSRGSPAELAWAYAELARQGDLRCDLVVMEPPSTGCLVQVRPGDGPPFLVDPARGAPLVEVASGQLLELQALRKDASAYADLMRLVGETQAPTQADFGAARVRSVIHPYALLPRFIVFQHLLADLPVHPHVAVAEEDLAHEAGPPTWEGLQRFAARATTGIQARASAEEWAALLTAGPREVELQGSHGEAEEAYAYVDADLRDKLSQADVPRAISAMNMALEHLAFVRAVNALDGGAAPKAAEALRAYLDDYPAGPWAATARAALAEALLANGEEVAAQDVYRSLPPPRRLYGILRLKARSGAHKTLSNNATGPDQANP